MLVASAAWPASGGSAEPGALVSCEVDKGHGALGEIVTVDPLAGPSYMALGPGRAAGVRVEPDQGVIAPRSRRGLRPDHRTARVP